MKVTNFKKEGEKRRVLNLVFVFMSTDRTKLQATDIRVKQNNGLQNLLQLVFICKEFINSYLIKYGLLKKNKKNAGTLFLWLFFGAFLWSKWEKEVHIKQNDDEYFYEKWKYRFLKLTWQISILYSLVNAFMVSSFYEIMWQIYASVCGLYSSFVS